MSRVWFFQLRFVAVALAYLATYLLLRRSVPFIEDSPWFVIVAMICVLGLAAMAGPLVVIRVPRPWRDIRPWERGGVYRILGVPAFGRLLRTTSLRLLNTDVYLQSRASDAARLSTQLEAAEASHVWAAVLVVPYMMRLGIQEEWSSLLWVLAAQIVINVYPVMHLRLTRFRVGRLLGRPARSGGARASGSASLGGEVVDSSCASDDSC